MDSPVRRYISSSSKPKGRVILLVGGLILAVGLYLSRERVERAMIAYRVYRARIFTPPPSVPGETRWRRLWDDAQFYWDFSAFRVNREKRLRQFDPVLKPLVKEIVRRQASGEGMQYSMHIYREIRWRLNFTPDVETTQARIADLRESLAQREEQKSAAEQQASDGSWGRGITVWYLRLYYSVDEGLDCKTSPPEYPLSFLDRVNSPEKLKDQLDSDLYDDFNRTKVFNREELDETFSAMARLLFKRQQTSCYEFHPRLRDALREFVESWQNAATGCWGQWMVDRKGRIWKMDDMGITFHVLSDLHGQVGHQDMIAKRLLQLDRTEFPAGIQFDGHYENHLNWDAVKIFRSAWPTLDDKTRQQVGAEISRMLDWGLAKSYQPDGSFKVSDLDDTLGDAYYYGVSFLREVGYFRREERFWTDRDFSNAQVVHDRIETKLKATGPKDPKMKDAYEALDTAN